MTAADLSPVELAEVQRFGMHLPETLRNVPTQKRSTERLEQLLAAAKTAYAANGRDRFTTAQVAELSGASIGTIYRYFDDRVAIMDAIDPDRDAHLLAEEWWIVTAPFEQGGHRRLGPFVSRDLALEVRSIYEQTTGGVTYAVDSVMAVTS